MKDTWSLDILYKGYDDTFQKDIKAFEKSVKQCDELASALSHDNEKETLVNILKTMEEMALLHIQLFDNLQIQPIHKQLPMTVKSQELHLLPARQLLHFIAIFLKQTI